MKRRSKSRLLLALGCASLAMPIGTTPASARTEIAGATRAVPAETEGGKILGLNEDGVFIFKGIPYGRAERFEMPAKPAPWKGRLTAFYAGPVSPRPADSGEYLSNPAYYRVDTSEKDLLNLNVWSPDIQPGRAKPVVVWLHGGGYRGGSSIELLEYDGKNLARFGDVVFVSVNHRLNYLGYLDLSAYGPAYARSGNLGHADLILALQWVRDNIGRFGGDPRNVTLVGQSGGSFKVSQLMAMPAADGLFSKAVVMSPGAYEFPTTHAVAQQQTAAVVKQLGLQGRSGDDILAALKSMPYEKLVAAGAAAGVQASAVVDNDYVLADISHSATRIPLMVGTVMGEFISNTQGVQGSYRNKTVVQLESVFRLDNRQFWTEAQVQQRYHEKYGDKADAVIAAFRKAYPTHDLFDGLYTWPQRSNHVAEAYTKAGGTAYQYVMAYNLPLLNGMVSWHTGGDIGFFFRNLDSIHSWVAGDEMAAERVSRETARALINFAYTGKPGQQGLAWPAFSPARGETMVFDRASQVRSYHDRDWLALVGATPPPAR